MSGLVARVIGSLLFSRRGTPLSLLPTTTVRVSMLSDQSRRWLHRSRLNTRLVVITPSKWMKLMIILPAWFREFSCSSNSWFWSMEDPRCISDGVVKWQGNLSLFRRRRDEEKRILNFFGNGYLRIFDQKEKLYDIFIVRNRFVVMELSSNVRDWHTEIQDTRRVR